MDIVQLKSKHKLYKVFIAMKQRCYNSKCVSYKNYGGRGIKICEEWLNSYDTFFTWCINNGYQVGKVIDRINNDGDYSPDNCRFANNYISLRNRRNVRVIEYSGEKKCLKEWAAILDIPYSVLQNRLKKGLPPSIAFNKDYKKPKRVKDINEAKVIGNTIKKYIHYHGRTHRWIIKKMNEAGFLIDDSSFSDKIHGTDNCFNTDESEFILNLYK